MLIVVRLEEEIVGFYDFWDGFCSCGCHLVFKFSTMLRRASKIVAWQFNRQRKINACLLCPTTTKTKTKCFTKGGRKRKQIHPNAQISPPSVVPDTVRWLFSSGVC